MFFRTIILTAAISAAASVACAQDDLTADEILKLSNQPGTEVSHSKRGAAIVTTWKRNGVTLQREVDGSRITFLGDDDTTKGAVVCVWMIYVGIGGTLALCPSEFADLRKDIDGGIAAIDNFTVVNSFKPVTLAELHAHEANEYGRYRAAAKVKPAAESNLCRAGDMGKMVSYLVTWN